MDIYATEQKGVFSLDEAPARGAGFPVSEVAVCIVEFLLGLGHLLAD